MTNDDKRFVLEDIFYVYDGGELLGAEEVVEVMNYLHDETNLLKDKLKKIDNVLPHYLSCREIREFHHDLYEEEMALVTHYKKRVLRK